MNQFVVARMRVYVQVLLSLTLVIHEPLYLLNVSFFSILQLYTLKPDPGEISVSHKIKKFKSKASQRKSVQKTS